MAAISISIKNFSSKNLTTLNLNYSLLIGPINTKLMVAIVTPLNLLLLKIYQISTTQCREITIFLNHTNFEACFLHALQVGYRLNVSKSTLIVNSAWQFFQGVLTGHWTCFCKKISSGKKFPWTQYYKM